MFLFRTEENFLHFPVESGRQNMIYSAPFV